VPLEGHSSPVIWKNRLFLTGASREQHQVYCFDTSVGTLLWTRDVPGTPKASFKVDDLNGYASPTPATDGRFLYVSFATGDLAALDFSGKVIWTRSLGIPKNEYGHATSLRVYKNLLLVQYDQGSTAKEGLSRFLALNTANGQTVWEVKRPVPNSWATPIVVEVQGRDQIITCGDPWAIAYDATDGKEIWRANCLKQDMTPSPVFADGILIVALAHRSASALHVDGQGDVTNSKILWSEEESLPDTTSPLIVGSQVLFLTTHGARLTSRDLKTGKLAWELEIEGEFKASPSLVGKFVYLFSWDGKAYVIEPGPDAAKVVFSTNMEDKFSASPAFQEGRLFVRGQKELFCIGKKR
jgi:outer membrane protein assembly factor BamB